MKRIITLIGVILQAMALNIYAASIKGVIKDESGAVIAQARVNLITHLGSVLTRVTDREGRYSFEGLQAGRYRISASYPGFRADAVTVQLASDQDRVLDITMRVSAISDEIVVTAALVEAPLSNVGDSTTVITRQEIREQQAQTVLEVLRNVPGLAVVNGGRRGGLTSVFARGGESDFNLVLIDGIEVNNFGGFFDFAHLPAENVDRIEVVRGPQSALYGSNAIGSVINIITRKGQGPMRFSFSGEGGSYDTRRFTISGGGQKGGFSWAVDLSRLDTDGVVINDDYRNQNLSLNLGCDLSADSRLTFKFNANANDAGFPGPFGSDPLGAFARQGGIDTISRGKNNFYVWGASWEQRVTERFKHHLRGSIVENHGTFRSRFGGSRTDQFRRGITSQSDLVLSPNNMLSFGLSYEREGILNTFITDASFNPFTLFRDNLGYFVEDRFQLGQSFFLNAGVRIENIRTPAIPGNPSRFVARPDFPASSIVKVNPKISSAYYARHIGGGNFFGTTKIHGSFGTGIRAPDGFEIAFTDNPLLKPEKTISFDVGLEQSFLGGRVVADATYFFNRFDDLIVGTGGTISTFRTDNIANSRAQGFELSFKIRPSYGITLSGHYTFLETEVLALDRTSNLAPSGFLVGQPLLRRPRHSGSYSLTWRRGKFTFNTDATLRGSVLDVEPNFGLFGGLFRNKGYVKADVGFAYELASGVTFYGRIDNLLNQKYEEAFGFPSLKINFTSGLRFDLPGAR